ncbi:MAG TPA: putative toxin-antitoxin system toxin component, PIN family [Chloroflexia bacterium]|jgi:putative PIN family toxin of toxin-antitoxin system
MKVVLDTNVVVSRFISPTGIPARLIDRWSKGSFDLVISEPILIEYQQALTYAHVRKLHGYTDRGIVDWLSEVRQASITIIPTQALSIVRADPKDDKFIECAVAGNADYIVSGDKHLLSLGEYEGIRIFSPADFLDVLEQGTR